MRFGSTSAGFLPCESRCLPTPKAASDTLFRSLTEIQKGATFYLITLGMAVLLALFGPTGSDAIQILNMLTATAGVLLMLLVITPTRLATG
jgi:hypothetical protein